MYKEYLLTLSIISSIVLFAYWPGLSGPLILDDWPQIVPLIHDLSPDNWLDRYEQYVFSNSGILKRPVSMLSFIFNAITTGDDIWYWKFTNIVLHIFCAPPIFALTRILLSLDNKNNSGNVNTVSLGITAVWLLHPLHVSTALYLVQRMTILSTLFTVSALSCYLYALQKSLVNEQYRLLLAISVIVFFPLAIFSKENAALLPVYILILTAHVMQTESISFSQLSRHIKTYNIFMLAMVVVGLCVLIIYQDKLIFNSYKTREFTLAERLLTEPRVLFMYLSQIFFPIPSSMGFFHDDFSISKNLTRPYSTFFSISTLLIVFFIIKTKYKKFPLLLFGVLFFFVSHLFESTFFPLEIAFEHRNHIGMWGIILATISPLKSKKIHAAYILVPLCFLLFNLTNTRAKIWGNSRQMYTHMLSIHPNSNRLNIIFAESYTSSGRHDQALEYIFRNKGLGAELQRSTILCNRDGLLHLGFLVDSTRSGLDAKIGTYEMEGIITLSNLGLDNKCKFSKNEFIEFLSAISKSSALKNADAQKIFIYIAHYYHLLEQHDNAINALELSFTNDISNPIPLFLMVEWLYEYKQYDRAIATFTKAKQVANNSFYDYSDFIARIAKILN